MELQRGGEGQMAIWTGFEVLRSEAFSPVKNKTIGIITNHTGLTKELQKNYLILLKAGIKIKALFGPEHGLTGIQQDAEAVSNSRDVQLGLPVYSLYNTNKKPTAKMLKGLNALVFDMQDLGTRCFTYIYTMIYSMEVAARYGLEFVVLDRPNPLTGHIVQGRPVDQNFESFVGGYRLPLCYGMTIGELANFINEEFDVKAELAIIQMKGWDRGMWFDQTELPWVPPSPNVPTLDTAVVYPGTVLFEGTNVSEGRGTTKPFELIGAPWIKTKKTLDLTLQRLEDSGLKGVMLREASFIPVFSKYKDEECHGFQLHVAKRDGFHSFKVGLVLLKTISDLHPKSFKWLYTEGRYFFDFLTGTNKFRELIDDQSALEKLLSLSQEGIHDFDMLRRKYLLYP